MKSFERLKKLLAEEALIRAPVLSRETMFERT